jgi:cytochrome c oxidase subunit 2
MLTYRSVGRLAGILLIFILTGCAGAPSSVAPASTNARAITDLMWGFSGVAVLGFILVEGLLIFTIIRFRQKDGSGSDKGALPRQTEGNRFIELAWTVVPALLLLIIFIFTVSTLWAITGKPSTVLADPQMVNVHVVGHQWWWEFQYPDLNITTADEMHVPVNALVYITVDSADVIHSFWVPQMGGKIDVIPGHPNHTWFQPTQTGIFVGECSEFCGEEHAQMRLDLIVESSDKYDAWVRQQQAPLPVLTGVAAQGEQVFLKGACTACHTIDGTQAAGKVGPNLTHFGGRQILAGAVLTNTPENLATWLKNPPAVKPGVKMPNLGLTDSQIQQLVAFLDSLQ